MGVYSVLILTYLVLYYVSKYDSRAYSSVVTYFDEVNTIISPQ